MQSDMAPNPSVVGFSLWAHLPGAGICRARRWGGGSLRSQLMLRVSQSVSGPASLKTKASAFCKERQAHSLGCVGWPWNLGPNSSFYSSFTSVLLYACTTNPLSSLCEGACASVPEPSRASVLGTRFLAVLFPLQAVRFLLTQLGQVSAIYSTAFPFPKFGWHLCSVIASHSLITSGSFCEILGGGRDKCFLPWSAENLLQLILNLMCKW